jgi:predicted metalloendopeptidase
MDRSVNPGDDFYSFVNGGWMKNAEIPSDRSSWGSFHELSKETDEKNLEILDAAITDEPLTQNKAAIFYQSGMNTAAIEKERLKALKPTIEEIKTLQSTDQLSTILASLTTKGLGGLVHFSVHPDMADSHIYAAYLEPGILGLPDRDFYLDEDEKATNIRNQYVEYITRLLTDEAKYADHDAEIIAVKILELEKNLSVHMLPKEDRRQIEKLYNPFTSEALKNLCHAIDWSNFFLKACNIIPEQIIVTEPTYFKFLDEWIKNISIDEIKEYLIFLTIHHAAPFAQASLEEANFDLYHRKLEGIEQMRPRKERIVKVVNNVLGDALGQLFVSKYFPETAKATAKEMVGDIIKAFEKRIGGLKWMSNETKKYAIEKLASFNVKIGYPDTWKEYDQLEIKTEEQGGHYLENMIAAVVWKFKKDVARIGGKVDREEWFMAPQVVNAYYNPMFNEIVFPAAILQPPFFDWRADAAVNYGGIGAVIGHEITHGFDDQGSRFDKNGNLNEWWTEDDRKRFQELTVDLVKQFDAYYPFEDLSLNGTYTLGENIADLGGLSVAYDALKLYYQRHGEPGPIDGFTPDQRFFMSWATVWRTKIRPEALRHQIKTDPHPPGLYRAVAAPSNLNSFYDAFEINPESTWFRRHEDRIEIW